MYYKILKNRKQCLNVDKSELGRLPVKTILSDKRLSFAFKYLIKSKFLKQLRAGSRNRVRKRCVFTGRPRFLISKFKMSRLVFQDFVRVGMLFGIKKSSW